MPLLLGLLAVIAGALNTVQSGANAALHKATGEPIFAALVVAATNVIVYLAVVPFVGLAWPAGKLSQTPWWAWTGGFLGAAYVLCVIFLAERLGAALFTGLTVTAAIVTSVLLDHFGWVGFERHAAGVWRWVGCILMVGGLALVSRF